MSQHRPDRHPVGLLVVVGLHVLLAAVLLSAKLVAKPPAEVPFVPLTPLDPVKPVQPKSLDLPKPPDLVIRTPMIVPPVIPIDPPPPDTIHGQVDEHPKPPDIQIAEVGHGGDGDAHGAGPPDAAPGPHRRRRRRMPSRLPAPPRNARRDRHHAHPLLRRRAGRISARRSCSASGSSRENRLMDKAAVDALAQCPVQVGNDEMGRPTSSTADVDYVDLELM